MLGKRAGMGRSLWGLWYELAVSFLETFSHSSVMYAKVANALLAKILDAEKEGKELESSWKACRVAF